MHNTMMSRHQENQTARAPALSWPSVAADKFNSSQLRGWYRHGTLSVGSWVGWCCCLSPLFGDDVLDDSDGSMYSPSFLILPVRELILSKGASAQVSQLYSYRVPSSVGQSICQFGRLPPARAAAAAAATAAAITALASCLLLPFSVCLYTLFYPASSSAKHPSTRLASHSISPISNSYGQTRDKSQEPLQAVSRIKKKNNARLFQRSEKSLSSRGALRALEIVECFGLRAVAPEIRPTAFRHCILINRKPSSDSVLCPLHVVQRGHPPRP
ncbi:hypothetical protein AOQ84DRAFT_60925 [Glonium stellatum]|uniref:Uncharacterized protein n=1 Tax=Glonium stellatum TaxID=574774 RepID=A0A8E2FFA1_9PEZI|nr:hypothetical protein AOQ84DRAFT_60925 [Glonium stellatum]